jgi:transposase-like protein
LLKKNCPQQLSQFIKRNHVSICKWIQWYKPRRKIFQKRSKVSEFIIDETYYLQWAINMLALDIDIIDSIDKVILDIHTSFERTVLIAEMFIKDLVKKYGKKHSVSTDGGYMVYPSL